MYRLRAARGCRLEGQRRILGRRRVFAQKSSGGLAPAKRTDEQGTGGAERMLTRLIKAPEENVVSLISETAECSFGIHSIMPFLLTAPIQGYWRIAGLCGQRSPIAESCSCGFVEIPYSFDICLPSHDAYPPLLCRENPSSSSFHRQRRCRPLTSMPIHHHLALLHRLPPWPQMKHLPRLHASLEALLRRGGNDLGRILGLPSVANALEQLLLRGCAACPEFVGDVVGGETGADGGHGWLGTVIWLWHEEGFAIFMVDQSIAQ